MGIEALKQQLKEGKITKEQFLAEAKKLLDAKNLTQEEYDSAIKEADEIGSGAGGDGNQTLTPEQVQKMIDDAVAAAQQSAADKVRTEYAAKLKQEQEEKEKLLKDKMTEEEKAKFELEKLQRQNEETAKQLLKEQVSFHTVKTLANKSLPASFDTFLAGSTIEETDQRIAAFEKEWQIALNAAVDEVFKKGGGEPGKGKGGGNAGNPWSKEHWNLTEQGKIYREDKEKARQLAAAAGAKLP